MKNQEIDEKTMINDSSSLHVYDDCTIYSSDESNCDDCNVIYENIVLDYDEEFEVDPLAPEPIAHVNDHGQLVVQKIARDKLRMPDNNIMTCVTPRDLSNFTIHDYIPLYINDNESYSELVGKTRQNTRHFVKCSFCNSGNHHIKKCKIICRLPQCLNTRVHSYRDWHHK